MLSKKRLVAMTCAVLIGVSALSGCSSASKKPSGTSKEGESSGAAKNDWPKKSIQLVVPFGAGGDTDFNARAIAKYLEKELGQSVVVSNVEGSGGSIGAAKVKDSKPDGYTALVTHVSLNINEAAGITNYGYKDFAASAVVGRSIGDAILVRGESPWKTVQDMIKDTKANPKKYKIAANTGATTHWVAIALKNAGADFNVVNSGGAAERVPALLGGHVDVICNSISSVQDYLKTGQFRALALATEERAKAFPDVPTLAESGVNCAFNCSYTIFFPKGTDSAITEKMSKAVENIVKNNKEYAKEINNAYKQEPFYLNTADTLKYYEKQRSELMNIADDLQGKKK